MNNSLNNLSIIQIFIVLCLNFIIGHWDNNTSNSVEAILRWQRGSEKSDQTFIYSLLTLISKVKKKKVNNLRHTCTSYPSYLLYLW